VIAGDILRESFPVLAPDSSLAEALERFSQHEGERLPAVSEANGRRLLGRSRRQMWFLLWRKIPTALP